MPVIRPAEIASFRAKGARLLDVREPDEYAAAHLPGALSVPRDQLASRIAAVAPDVNAPLICYCRTGYRAVLAVDELRSLGYTAAYAVAGGLDGFPADTPTWSGFEI